MIKVHQASGYITVQVKVTSPGNWSGNESMENLHKSIARECVNALENCIHKNPNIEILGAPEVTLVSIARNKT